MIEKIKIHIYNYITDHFTKERFLEWVKKQLSIKMLLLHLVDLGLVILLLSSSLIGYIPVIIYGSLYFIIYLVVSIRRKILDELARIKEGYHTSK